MKRLLMVVCAFWVPSVGMAELAVEQVEVREIRLIGPLLLPAKQVRQTVEPYEGRLVSFAELITLRDELSRQVIAAGYISSGVVLPDQEIIAGVVEYKFVSNRLSEIRISGVTERRQRSLRKLMDTELDGALNVDRLNRAMRQVEQKPGVAYVQGKLTAGSRRGESALDLRVFPADTRTLNVTGNNYRSPSVGEDQGVVSYVDTDLLGYGDQREASIGAASGVDSYALSYSVPLRNADRSLTFYWDQSDSDIVEAPFDRLDIETESSRYGARLQFVLDRQANQLLNGFIAVTGQKTQSKLLGQNFSFSPGEQDGESRSTSLSIGAELARQLGKNRFAWRATLKRGLHVNGATNNHDDIADGGYTAILMQAQYVRDLSIWGSQLTVKSTLQHTEDALLPHVRIPLGGRHTVRGYRENQLVRDRVLMASVEWRIPMPEVPGRFTTNLFTDAGVASNVETGFERNRTTDLSSIGIGFSWQTPIEGLNMEAHYAHAFRDFDSDESSLQGSGLHYQLSYSYKF